MKRSSEEANLRQANSVKRRSEEKLDMNFDELMCIANEEWRLVKREKQERVFNPFELIFEYVRPVNHVIDEVGEIIVEYDGLMPTPSTIKTLVTVMRTASLEIHQARTFIDVFGSDIHSVRGSTIYY